MTNYNTSKKMRVALVYDRINKWGGAERVLLALHELFPDAPLYTSVYDAKNTPWAKVFKIKTSFLQNITGAKNNHELLAPLMPLAFEKFNFDKYDLVISVTSEAAKGIVTGSKTLHICYCLTPTRYLWSGYDEYFKNKSIKLLSKPVVSALRKWDKSAAKRPDVFIAISKEVQERIKKYYGRESKLIYPPVMLSQNFSNRHSGEQRDSRISNPRDQSDSGQARMTDYFLVVSRLSKFTRYKRVDLVIEACNKLKLPLVIVGEGSLRKELEKKAGSTVEFVGKVSDRELIGYYQNCKALIFSGREDLGLVMIEAQMQGKPVVAYKAGGALELIIEGKTGLFFEKQEKKSLVDAIQKFELLNFDKETCIKNAKTFGYENFEKNFLSVVNNSIKHYNK